MMRYLESGVTSQETIKTSERVNRQSRFVSNSHYGRQPLGAPASLPASVPFFEANAMAGKDAGAPRVGKMRIAVVLLDGSGHSACNTPGALGIAAFVEQQDGRQ